jgi:hypothetical protein
MVPGAVFSGEPAAGALAFRFADPDIPDGEILRYTCLKEGEAAPMEERVMVRRDGERELYEIRLHQAALDAVVYIERQTMQVLRINHTRRYRDATTRSTFELLHAEPNTAADEIKVPHFMAINYLLRGFPFGSLPKLKISYYSEESKRRFQMSVRYNKRERLRAPAGEFDCHMLEFGLDGFWGTFLPSIKMWYAVEPPHYLVRYEGSMGMPGSSKSTIELVERIVPPAPPADAAPGRETPAAEASGQ